VRIHFIQHVPFEDLGYIETYLKQKKNSISSTKMYENSLLPNMNDFDVLFVMGGPMGVYDESIFSWLKKEKQFIKEAIKKEKKVIGICLGAQLIADVLAAKVYINKESEIGWFNIAKIKPSSFMSEKITKNLSNELIAFHWHRDTFDLPENSTLLFENETCHNQGFLYKSNVLALQFHLEVTNESIDNLTYYCQDDLVNAMKLPYVQSEQEIKLFAKKYISLLNKNMTILLDNFIESN